MNLHQLHRVLAGILGVFIVLHLTNHLALFWGVETHLRLQEILRLVYRNPIIEPLLILGFVSQIFIGIRLLIKRGWPKKTWARLQTISGAILALFLLQHISAALFTRFSKPDIDTNIYWAASVVSRLEFALYFAPYYTLGLFALFLHIATFLAIRKRKASLAIGIVILGGVFSIALVSTLSGGFFEIELPHKYEIYLDEF